MMNKMIVSNLAHRPVRSVISIAAIGLEVTLILLIVGFSLGMLNGQRERQAGIGADAIVLPPGSSNLRTSANVSVDSDLAASQHEHGHIVKETYDELNRAGKW